MSKLLIIILMYITVSICYADTNTQCITNDNYTNCLTTDNQTGRQVQDTQCYGSDGYLNCNTTN